MYYLKTVLISHLIAIVQERTRHNWHSPIAKLYRTTDARVFIVSEFVGIDL